MTQTFNSGTFASTQPNSQATSPRGGEASLVHTTHEVINQPSALEQYNAFGSDLCLRHYVDTFGGAWGHEQISGYGARVGGDLIQAGFDANRYAPEFHSHDRFGHRIDQVNFHPSYHKLMSTAIEHGIPSMPWRKPASGANVVRAALSYLHTQADPGTGCPLTMTFAAVPALKHQPDIAEHWLPKVTAPHYNPGNLPFYDKHGLTIGMAMTEKQGGSDVRANTTRAIPDGTGGPGQLYSIVGHKWFCSAPMCDAFLVLAQTAKGLSCFLLPRWRPDGSKNAMEIQRLKHKMGNVSNASSEVEYRNALAWMIGDEGRGVRTIIEMVAMTRFDCMLGSSAIMRQAVAQALHHTGGRSAFGANLHNQPLMQNVLADLALESEAALAITMRLAHALDNPHSEYEQLLVRLGTGIGKYWICKRAAQFTYEAMECIGGVGVVEDNILARLYRECPINAIWEGSGNIQCLDVKRALDRSPRSQEVFLAELEKTRGHSDLYDRALHSLKMLLTTNQPHEAQLRKLVEHMALVWQANTLLQFAPEDVADAFIRGRLDGSGHMYGTLPHDLPLKPLLKRAQPQLD